MKPAQARAWYLRHTEVWRPTGDCFADAMLFFERVGVQPRDFTRYLIVHAACALPTEDRVVPFAHAWVEETDARKCWMAGIGPSGILGYSSLPRADLYVALRVASRIMYGVRDALELNHRWCHFGPWVPSLMELGTRKPPTLAERVRSGELLTEDTVSDEVERWHLDQHDQRPLHERLGFTAEEYARWVEGSPFREVVLGIVRRTGG